VQLRKQTPDHFIISFEVLQRSTGYRSERESLTNQADTGV